MRRAHLLFGLVGVAVFLGTGLYMRSHFPELYGDNQALRFMYRANHVYILLASLVNVALGVYLGDSAAGWRSVVSKAGSGLVLLSPVILSYAFFAEAPTATPERVFTMLGVIALFAGVLGQLPNARLISGR